MWNIKRQRKKVTEWKKATIANNYMFRLVMEHEELCKGLLERVLGIKITKLTYLDYEKSLEPTKPDGKGIRLDIYVTDDKGVAYDIEMQASSDNSADLGKRARYYQSLMDADALKKGQFYGSLRKSLVIFICTFDPFGKNFGRYTFNSICEEDKELSLNDGTTKLFINVKGNKKDLSPELASLMEYIASGKIQDSFTAAINEKVENLRLDNGKEERYMMWQQEVMEWEKRGYNAGRSAGYNAGMLDGSLNTARNMRKKGMSDDVILDITGLPLSALENL